MSTQQLQLVCDSSNFTNFKAWAKPISDWFGTCGWTQSTDTGQVVWTATVLTLTQATLSSGNGVYAYSSYTGPAPRVGMSVIVTGFTNAGNNATLTLTAVSGGSSGTVTAVNASAVNETHSGSATTTAASAVPGSGSYVYEAWQPGDGLTTFYLKVEYGNGTTPQIRVSLATGTNGSGTLNGLVTNLITVANQSAAAPSTTTQYECNFSGTTGRIAVMMWRNSPNNNQQLFAVERSLNSTGSATSTYATLYACGQQGSLGSGRHQSVVFGVGVAQDTLISGDHTALNVGGFNGQGVGDVRSLAFNGSIPIDFVRPLVGYYDYPGTVVGAGSASDFVSGVTFTATVYGSTVTYMPASNNQFSHCALPTNAAIASLLMRYD